MSFTIASAIAFQAAWLAAVLGAARGLPWLGLPVAGLYLAFHVAWRGRAARTLALVIVAVACGVLFDSAVVALGAVGFPPAARWPGWSLPTTAWMLALWANFAVALEGPLAWLGRPAVPSALVGLVFGPLAYWGGARLGASTLNGWGGAFLVAIAWMVALPVLIAAQRMLAVSPTPAAPGRRATAGQGGAP